MVLPRALIAAGALVATVPAFAHGASRGLHLHLPPEGPEAGGEVEVRVDAAEAFVELRLSFAGEDPVTIEPEPPVRSRVVRLAVPTQFSGETLSLQAEAVTATGKIVRASAILRPTRARAPSGGPVSGLR